MGVGNEILEPITLAEARAPVGDVDVGVRVRERTAVVAGNRRIQITACGGRYAGISGICNSTGIGEGSTYDQAERQTSHQPESFCQIHRSPIHRSLFHKSPSFLISGFARKPSPAGFTGRFKPIQ